MEGAGEVPLGWLWSRFPRNGCKPGQRWRGLWLRDWEAGQGHRLRVFRGGSRRVGPGGLVGGFAQGRCQGPWRSLDLAVCDAVF